MNRTKFDVTAIRYTACLIAGLGVVVSAFCSLWWRAVHDAPIMLYMARFMNENHAVPYRDFFDMNLPATYFFFQGVEGLFGTSDLALRVADLATISACLAGFYFGLRRWGKPVASLGVGLAALRIFSGTWAFSLQRELLIFLPLGVLFAWGMCAEQCRWWQGFWAGILMAWLALLKPQWMLLGVPLCGLLVVVCQDRKTAGKFVLASGMGFALLILCAAEWLYHQGAWDGFREVVRYWPLYCEMDGNHIVVTGVMRVCEILRGALRMLFSAYTGVALVGLGTGFRSGRLGRRHLFCWITMIVATILVPCLSGQFWGYHRLPFFLVTIVASCFVFLAQDGAWPRLAAIAGLCLALFWSGLSSLRSAREAFLASAVSTKKGDVPDIFCSFLQSHLDAEDRVQPIGWTGGAVHGMLMAGAKPATRFLYTFHFYHHVQTPLIQKLRSEFMGLLSASPPRFLLESVGEPFPSGEGTEQDFAIFDRWKNDRYHVAEFGPRYKIWELNRE